MKRFVPFVFPAAVPILTENAPLRIFIDGRKAAFGYRNLNASRP